MLISHRKKFIYTKTARTAGTSVELYFEKYCMAEGAWEFSHGREVHVSEDGIIGLRGIKVKEETWYNHMSAEEIKNNIGQAIWDSYYKFCVIRNPYDRMISRFYNYHKRRNESLPKNQMELILHFRNFVSNINTNNDSNKYLINGEICVDYIIRYEDLENGIKHVCQEIDVPYETENIPKLKKSASRKSELSIRDYYDDKTINKMESLFAFEFNNFNYSFPE